MVKKSSLINIISKFYSAMFNLLIYSRLHNLSGGGSPFGGFGEKSFKTILFLIKIKEN